jgi:hypothetical protein
MNSKSTRSQKHFLITLVLSLTLVLPTSTASSATAKAGGSCSKINTFYETNSLLLVCVSNKGKKVWRKASLVEVALYKKEKARLAAESAQKIIDRANAEAERIALAEKAAEDRAAAKAAEDAATAKAVADKLAADAAAAKAAADKAAADKAAAKAAAEAAAKAAAEAAAKAAAEAAAKAAAEAAAKAAAEAAAKAADVPSVIAGRFFSGQDADNSNWKWIAVEIRNSSQYNILSHRSYDVLIGDSGGAIVNSSWEPGFPLLLPSQSAWYVTTQFNSSSSSQVVFRKTYSTQPSPLMASEFPTTSNSRLVTSPYYPNRKAVGFTLKNNSNSVILGSSSKAFAVVFNSAGVPIYAASGFIGKSIFPGGQSEITVSDFTFNGDYSYVLVTIGVNVG